MANISRFFVTSDSEYASSAKAIQQNAGLSPSAELPVPEGHGVVYDKRRIDVNNFEGARNQKFAACTGTLIYDGETGAGALSNLLDDFTGDVKEAQQQATGHYAVLIRTSDTIYIFGDRGQSYDIYYSTRSDRWFVSSDFATTTKVLDHITLNKTRLYERITQKTNIGGPTFYSEIRSLQGYEHIEITLDGQIDICKHNVTVPEVNYESLSMKEVVDRYANRVKTVFREISTAFPQEVGLQLTGGLDSRTILATLLSLNRRPQVFTGRGNSNITWTTPHDQRIVDNLSSKYELQYHKLDWTGEYTTHGPDMWRAYFKRYGFHFSKFGCTPNFFKEHESTIDSYPPIMLKGLSPIFSNSKPWEQNFEKKELSVQYFVRNYQFSNRLFDTGGMPCKEDLLRLLSEQVKTVIDADPQIELTENGNINTSDFTVLKAILARGSSSSVANFRNEYSYYLAPFELHPLLRPALEIPDNYRQRNEFQVRLIDTLESSVLDVPIASGAFGNKPQLIGPEKIPDPRSLKRKIADYLPSAIFSRVQNWDDKRKFKNHLSQYEQDSEIYESYLRRLQNSELYDGDFYFQKFYGDLSTLNSFVLFEFAVDEVGYTRAIN